jgi:divinyl chlorophyllide a 8-vinyl-reductase
MTDVTPTRPTRAVDQTTRRRVLVVGATGTIGRATVRALVRQGHEVVCFGRPRRGGDAAALPAGVHARAGDVGDAAWLERDGFAGERFDAVVSCMASRTGVPSDAWAVDHRRTSTCSRPRSGPASGTSCCCRRSACRSRASRSSTPSSPSSGGSPGRACALDRRPTAFFKSLSGQVERVRRGKPFLVFGDGALTACKPIADDDLAEYLVGCLDDASRWDRVLPVGGARRGDHAAQQGEQLFALLGRPPRFTHVPVRLLDVVAAALGAAGGSSRRWPRRPSSRASGATTRPSRCWCGTSARSVRRRGDAVVRARHARGALPDAPRERGVGRPRRPRGLLSAPPR